MKSKVSIRCKLGFGSFNPYQASKRFGPNPHVYMPQKGHGWEGKNQVELYISYDKMKGMDLPVCLEATGK